MTQQYSLPEIVPREEKMTVQCEQCDVKSGQLAKDTKAFKKRISTVLTRRIRNAKD